MDAGAARHRSRRVGLDAGQAEVADLPWSGRVGEVEDLQHAGRPPAVDGADEVRDAAVALPPVLVRVPRAGRRPARLRHRPQERGAGRLRHVPQLVAPVAVGPQQVEPPRLAVGQPVPFAHLDHLRPPGLAGRRDVGQVDGRVRGGDVDHRGAVRLHRARQRVERLAGVVADIEDAALALPDRERLVGRAPLQIVQADEPRVEALLPVAGAAGLRLSEGERGRSGEQAGDEEDPDERVSNAAAAHRADRFT